MWTLIVLFHGLSSHGGYGGPAVVPGFVSEQACVAAATNLDLFNEGGVFGVKQWSQQDLSGLRLPGWNRREGPPQMTDYKCAPCIRSRMVGRPGNGS